MLAKLEISPMLKSLMRNPYRVFLVISQIAITMAVVTNAIFIVFERIEFVSRDSGTDEANTMSFITEGFTPNFPAKATIDEDLRFIRDMPEVVSAIQSESLPYNDSMVFLDLQTQAGTDQNVTLTAYYRVDQFALETFDLELIAGENFDPLDVVWQLPEENVLPQKVMLSKATAISLFGQNSWQTSVGKTIYYFYEQPLVVVGIYDTLHAASPTWENLEFTMMVPSRIIESTSRYVVRAKPGKLESVMTNIESELNALNPGRKVRSFRTMESQKQQAFANDFATINLLGTVVVVVTLVTTIGIGGLVSLNISQRKRHIGIRRALGASKANIVAFFLVENLLLSLIGTSLGIALTVLINLQLVEYYSVALISYVYLPLAAVTILLISQLSALIPALKSAKIAPALATRNI